MSLPVVRLTESDLEALRAARREALRLHPENFSADPAIEEKAPPDRWLASLREGVWFGARDGGELAGMVAVSAPASVKTRHVADLGSMYVREAHRGSGLADALMNAALLRAAEIAEQVKLTVNAQNARAIRFYERHGFRTVGRMPRSLRVGGKDHDELIMVRPVSTSD